jgi:hypothetical protein
MKNSGKNWQLFLATFFGNFSRKVAWQLSWQLLATDIV